MIIFFAIAYYMYIFAFQSFLSSTYASLYDIFTLSRLLHINKM